MKKKILYTMPNLNVGGAERMCINILNILNEKGYDTSLLLHKKGGGFISEISRETQVLYFLSEKYFSSYLGRIVSTFLLPFLFIKLFLKVGNFSAVVSGLECSYISYLTILACWLRRTPIIVIVHNDISKNTVLKNSWHLQAVRFLYPFITHCVCVSEGVLAGVLTLVPKLSTNSTIIYNSFDINKIKILGKDPVSFKGKYIVAVGRLIASKRFDLLINAYAELRNNGICDLVIVGDGEEKERLKMLVEALNMKNNIHFVGFDSNPYRWIKNAIVLVSSSENEGFGNILVEALTLETPVISTDCPSGPKEILENGKYGILVPNKDVVSLRNAIERVINDYSLQIQMSENGAQRGRFFSTENIASYWDDLILKIIKQSANGNTN